MGTNIIKSPWLFCLTFLRITFLAFIFFLPSQILASKTVVLLDVKGAIGPATEEYIHQGIEHAFSENAEFIILRLNTPGGLDKAMRSIIQDIISAPLPIITYVGPEGSRAASAGTYILYASHIAAMAPATNLGAATPISLDVVGSEMGKEKHPQEKSAEEKKILSDSIAYLKGLAHLRHRNEEWAEQTVKDAASLQSDEALNLKVIDMVAQNIPDLLKQLNGVPVTVQNQVKVLQTQDLNVEVWEPDWRLRFLEVITDPSIAYILLIIGIWGLFFEFYNPGFVLPGVVGTIALLLALYAFQLLPIHYTGLALTLVGIGFMAAELFVPSYGVLSAGGLIAFFVGSVLLLDLNGYQTPWGLIIGMSIASISFFLFIIGFAIKARRRKLVSGSETLIGMIGVVQNDFKDAGWVKIEGELWKAHTPLPLKKGESVRIVKCKGLEVIVKPLDQKEAKDA
ncbi:MAG: nodulation protein NfeD [Alphaproteobacteria bacterium]|nr:nodulation protein NfeD [Alphaproteobacteria bacterium]